MTPLNSAEFRTRAKNGLKGGYLFYGEEAYLKEYCLKLAREVVLGGGDSTDTNVFNHIKLNKENYSAVSLENAITALPVFGEKKLIELHEFNFNGAKEGQIKELCDTLALLSEYDYNVVIVFTTPEEFDSGTVKKPSKNLTLLSDSLTPVSFEHQTQAKLNKWLISHFARENVEASPELCDKLIDITGSDMYALSGETAKLSAYVLSKGRNRLTAEDIELVASHNKEIDPYDFANAILDGNCEKAFYILSDMKLRREAPEMVFARISRVYCDLCMIKTLSDDGYSQREIAAKLKMNEYRVGLYLKKSREGTLRNIEAVLGLCTEADEKIKYTSVDSYITLERLVAAIAQISRKQV